MREPGTLNSKGKEEEEAPEVLNVAIAATVLLYTVLWLVGLVTGKFVWIRDWLRPYLPPWFLTANLLLTPVACALSGLKSLSLKTRFTSFLIFGFQLVILGLSAEKYPVMKALVVIFIYYEAFVLIPGRNRRFLEAQRGGTVLGVNARSGRADDH